MLDSLKNARASPMRRGRACRSASTTWSSRREKAALVEGARDEVIKVEGQYLEGAITNGERYNKVIAVWSDVTEKIADAMFGEMEELDQSGRNFNPVYIMADSGARGSKQQIRQLAGMRGLMAKPSGEIIETPITSNFREGPHGAAVLHLDARRAQGSGRHGAEDGRLGLPDPPARRRGAGRHHPRDRLRHDGRHRGAGDRRERRDHRAAARPHHRPRHAREDRRPVHGRDDRRRSTTRSTRRRRRRSRKAGIEKVRIRSVLTCASRRGCCAKCYGRDLATGKLVELGLAVGVIAAQSIGEPGTQLTMRTFHIGGTASRVSEQSTLDAKHAGTVRYQGLQVVETKAPATRSRRAGELVVMNRTGSHRRAGREGARSRALPDRLRRAPQGARRPGTSSRARSSSSGIRTRSRSSPRMRAR